MHRPLLVPTLAALLVAPLGAQAPAQDKDTPRAAARRAVEAWLASEQRDLKLRDQASLALLRAQAEGIAELSSAIAALGDGKDAEDRRVRGLNALFTHFVLGWLEAQRKSGMVYAGQYAPLAPLQPHVGSLFLKLVVDTPDWYRDDHRAQLVPALRDLFPKGPGADALKKLKTIALDTREEPEELRVQLAYALAQWGDRELVQGRLDELAKAAAGKEPQAALEAHFALADLHYNLREYPAAAEHHRRFLRGSEAAQMPPTPSAYYNAACCLSLAGDLEGALAELERCAKGQADPHVDPSVKVERRLFDEDPDLAAVRVRPRFAELVKVAFPPAKAKD
ncbi:MAG: hypothetical protein IT458_00215 [Planctomycetes bacterium]|nr:hypothetical protein [Planctomycetota bacterium]